MKQVTLKVIGMSCGHCVRAVEKALEDIGASGQVKIGSVTVNYDEHRLSIEKVKDAIEDLGYDIA